MQDEENTCWSSTVWLNGVDLLYATQLYPQPNDAKQDAFDWLDASDYNILRRFED